MPRVDSACGHRIAGFEVKRTTRWLERRPHVQRELRQRCNRNASIAIRAAVLPWNLLSADWSFDRTSSAGSVGGAIENASITITAMHGHDATGEIVNAAVFEPSLAHHGK
jgi:hypothetical protein